MNENGLVTLNQSSIDELVNVIDADLSKNSDLSELYQWCHAEVIGLCGITEAAA